MSDSGNQPRQDDDSQLSALGRNLLGSGASSTGSGSRARRWTPPSAEELEVQLPGYEIATMLGQGGMGAVYMGRQTSLDRPVAIKILSTELVEAEAGFVERFRNEARSMAKLEHPGIVAVYDFGETGSGLLYIVMQYVDGTDVARMIAADGRLHTEHAMAITAHVCDALNYAHERGIIHRDIKPANIMVGYDGVVKVADFGLAKMHEPDGNTLGLTQSGMMMGTMHYMAPEMMVLGTVDQRGDVYAVGVMLYHMLTGKVPHGMFELPSLRVTGLDPRYDGIIARAMREEPEARYQSVAELRGDLDAILTQPVAQVRGRDEADEAAPAALPTMARPRRPGGGRTMLKGEAARSRNRESGVKPSQHRSTAASFWPVAVAGMVIMAGGAWWWVESSTSEPPPEEPTAEAPPLPPPKDDTSAKAPIPEQAPATSREPETETPLPTTATATSPASANRDDAPEPPRPSEPPEPEAPILDPAEEAMSPASISGFTPRLETYLVTRNAELVELADQYGRGLDARLDRAADAGDLTLSSAFSDEKDRVAALRAAAEVAPADLLAAVEDPPELEALPADVPREIAELRQVWNREWETIRSDLDEKLQQSLQLLEAELTRSRALEEAREVRAWRERLYQLASDPPPADDTSTEPASVTLPAATRDAPFENSLGMKFVPVPGTEVLFCIHETRRRDYETYAKDTRNLPVNWDNQTTIHGYRIKDRPDDHPVVYVSWEDARAFCQWLGEKEGRTYRLPTDREWSIALGIGHLERWDADTTPETVFKLPNHFVWGEGWPPPIGAGSFRGRSYDRHTTRRYPGHLEDHDDGFPTTAPVMSFEPNQFGLYDLGGNAWEWVEDWFSDERKEKVLRGASWGEVNPMLMKASYRRRKPLDHRFSVFQGFRIVLVPSPDNH